jgi:hypothetical protein
MVVEIKEIYKGFHDALILNISYSAHDAAYKFGTKKNLTVQVHAFNQQNKTWQIIKLLFIDVIKFRFFESTKICSIAIFEAYIERVEDLVVFDFFALQVDGRDQLAEDPDSTFVVHCKDVNYEVMDISTL